MNYIERQLIDIVGQDNVSSDLADLIPYERDDQFALVPPHKPDFVVRPLTREEVQKILKLANRYRIPVVPLAAGVNRKGLCIPSKGGILLDLRRMNRILEINEEMMTATIEPGVTFGQLVNEVNKKTNLRVITPLAPSTTSVLANYMLRGIYGAATRYGTDHLISIEVILPDGSIVKTGSAAMPNGLPYCGIVNGPDLCKLFQANPGTLGVLTQGTIRLYPKPEVIKVIVTTYPSYEAMVKPTVEMTQRDLIAGCWTMMFSAEALKLFIEEESKIVPTDVVRDVYLMWLYIEGSKEKVEADEKALLKIINETGGTIFPLSHKAEEEMIKDYIWCRTTTRGWRMGSCYGCSFYGAMNNVPTYYKETYRMSLKYGFKAFHYEAVPVSPFHGQLTYNDPCIFWDSGKPSQVEKIRKLHKELVKMLVDIGIYGWFRPFPSVVDASILGGYGELWRKIKRLIDPNDIMNPCKPPF